MKNKVKKDDRPIVREKIISSNALDENNAFILGIKIPGKGQLNIKITFEEES